MLVVGVGPAMAAGLAEGTGGLAEEGAACAGSCGRTGAFTLMIWGRRGRVVLGMGRTRAGAC